MFGLEINEFALAKIKYNSPDVEPLTVTTGLMDNSIGSVVALHVFEHILDDNLDKIGVELNRVLKSKGRILAVMPDLAGQAHVRKGLNWSAFTDPTHCNLKAAKTWERYFVEQWDMRIVKSFSDGYYDFPYGPNRVRSAPAYVFHAARMLLQFLLARPLLPQDVENVVFIPEKRKLA